MIDPEIKEALVAVGRSARSAARQGWDETVHTWAFRGLLLLIMLAMITRYA